MRSNLDIHVLNTDTGGLKEGRRATVYTTTGFRNNLPDLQIGRYQHSCTKFINDNGKMVRNIFSCFLPSFVINYSSHLKLTKISRL